MRVVLTQVPHAICSTSTLQFRSRSNQLVLLLRSLAQIIFFCTHMQNEMRLPPLISIQRRTVLDWVVCLRVLQVTHTLGATDE